MILLDIDENSRDEGGRIYTLSVVDGANRLTPDSLGLASGTKVLIAQFPEPDFVAQATLMFGFLPYLARDAWYVVPDWDTAVFDSSDPTWPEELR